MKLFWFILLPIILDVGFADTSSILEMLFQFPDRNGNGVWEIEEFNGYGPEAIRYSLFEVIDSDEDQRITLKELNEICLELLQAIFKLHDHDSDGFVTSEEILSGNTAIQPNIEILAIIFKVLDINHDGYLTTEDLDARADTGALNTLDINKDGLIGIQEYNQNNDILGTPKAPRELVKLYNLIDKNRDDKFTLKEIQDVLRTGFSIMDADNNGIATLEEQLHALQQVGLSKAQADEMRISWQMSRSISFDIINKMIASVDTDHNEKVSLDELTAILESPYNPAKLQEMAMLGRDASRSIANDEFQLEPEQQLTGQQMLESLGRFLDNPRFSQADAQDSPSSISLRGLSHQNKVSTAAFLLALSMAMWILV